MRGRHTLIYYSLASAHTYAYICRHLVCAQVAHLFPVLSSWINEFISSLLCSSTVHCMAYYIASSLTHTMSPLFLPLSVYISICTLLRLSCNLFARTVSPIRWNWIAALQSLREECEREREKEIWIDYLLLSSIVYRVHKCAYKRIQMLSAIDLLSKCAGRPRNSNKQKYGLYYKLLNLIAYL